MEGRAEHPALEEGRARTPALGAVEECLVFTDHLAIVHGLKHKGCKTAAGGVRANVDAAIKREGIPCQGARAG